MHILHRKLEQHVQLAVNMYELIRLTNNRNVVYDLSKVVKLEQPEDRDAF